MKRISMAMIFVISIVSGSQAQAKRPAAPPPPGPLRADSVQLCADELYWQLSTFSSTLEKACSYGATDASFRRCVVDLVSTANRAHDSFYVERAGYLCANEGGSRATISCVEKLERTFGGNSTAYSLSICKQSNHPQFAQCVSELFLRGGQYAEQAVVLCRNGVNRRLNDCIIEEYGRGHGASGALATCKVKYDPETRARVEAEKRRKEEQRRLEAERKAAEERRRQEEIRRKQDEQSQQNELKRKQEEERRRQEAQKRKEEEEKRKKEEEGKAKNEPVRPPLPTPLPSDGDDGVIVDLPMFE